MATSSTETLRSIEAGAERAIVQELKIMQQQVLALCPSLNMEDRAYADGLLLKLDRLIDDQLVLPQRGSARPAQGARATEDSATRDAYDAAEPVSAVA